MRFFNKKEEDFIIESPVIKFGNNQVQSPHALTEEEVLSAPKAISTHHSNSALESLKERLAKIAIPEDEDDKESLLDKCMPYIIEEDGTDASVDTQPLYNLQSVAEILKEQSTKSIEALSKKYDLIFEDLTVKNDELPDGDIVKPEPTESEEPVSTKIKNVQSNISFVISDIDSTTISPEIDMSDTATITFTPVSDDKSSKHINVSTQTKPIDLTNELVKIPETAIEEIEEKHCLEKSEFEEYVNENEIYSLKDAAKLKRFFALGRRNYFFAAFISFFVTLLLVLTKIPLLSQLLLTAPKVSMIVCTALTLITVISNMDMFLSFKDIFKAKCRPDILPSIASIETLAFAIFGIIDSFDVINILLLLNFILSVRAVCACLKSAYMLTNIKTVYSNQNKSTVKLINDTAITFSMARNSVEGDALIAAPQDCKEISGFMKYSTYDVFLGGKLPFITAVSLILSLICSLAAIAYFDGVIYGLYVAAAIQCFASLPCIFFIDTLPLYATAKKLRKSGAAILGKKGAEQIEMANAVVIDCMDIFPKGTVTLHQMKILSENNLDDTLIRAAALTEYTGNTLAPIFKTIAKSGNISVLPDTDTVKYEERLGISGWVDNRLLFIGNRTLMETHGIKVPSIDVDRRILSQGYFPVYVATREKACALLIIQYNVDTKIARELRRLTSTGVTLLVNNTDPNLTEEMICDYLGLYEDSVKVMSSAGSYMFKNATAPIESILSPAVYKKSPCVLASILNCATKIKRANIFLTVTYIICACLGAIIFAYTSFGGSSEPLSQTVTLLYGLFTTVISYLIYLTERP